MILQLVFIKRIKKKVCQMVDKNLLCVNEKRF